MKPFELIKCPKCGWVHFFVDEGERGTRCCFLCSGKVEDMIPATEDDCPIGCTMQGVERPKGEKDD